MSKVEILKYENDTIEAKVDDCNIRTALEFNSPFLVDCSCGEDSPCIHEIALRDYLKNNPEILETKKDINKIINLVSEKQIKEFLIKEMSKNETLRENFENEFANKEFIDKLHYYKKLKNILSSSSDSDSESQSILKLEDIEDDLIFYIDDDIAKILHAEEYSFACDLLFAIALHLDNDEMKNEDSWYNIGEAAIDIASVLYDSVNITGDDGIHLQYVLDVFVV